uniref:Uncharacterized protein n=1 Tax=Timema bartmani TaxID=61472 RepID=A0A7R9F0U5_9NEOP|nr:unnamed protein product [Timema bartmani]
MRCLGSDSGAGERFLVFGRTQCGEEMYTCMWIKRRGMNVLEFQIGLQSSTYYNSSLCSNTNFQLNQWITQGRMERLQESPCPVAGEYAGYIPDATGLCAKLSSDCKSPEIMYYTVSDCSHNEIYEGSRRHGRKHRQIGTRVFRISDPHTTSVSPSLFSHSTTSLSNQHVTVTNHWAGNQNNLNDSYKTDIYRNNNNNRNPYQISERKEHSTSGYFLGGNSSPQYPTAYRNLERPNSKSTPQTNDYSDEVYDPWAFSKTHSQRYNQTFTSSTPLYHAPIYSSLFDNIPENSEHYSRGPYSSFSTYDVNSEPSSHNTDYSGKRNFNYASKHDSSNSDSQFHQRNLNVRGDNIYYGNNERSHGIENGVHRNSYQDIPSSTVFTDPNFSSNIGFNNNNQGIFHVPKISPNTNVQNQPHFISSPKERVNSNMPSNRNFPRPPYSYEQTQAGGGYYTKSATPIEQINYFGTPLDATPDQTTEFRNTFRNQMGNPGRQFQNPGYPNTVVRQGDDQHDSPGTGRNVHTNQFSSSNHYSDPRNPSNKNVNHDISATPSQIQDTRINHTRLGFSSPPYSQHSLPEHQNRRPETPSPVSRPLSVPFPNISPLSHRSSATPRSTEREEREYRCLGQWEENGRMFTYTQRRDVGSFECFVGSILSDTEIFIKEAGDHCQRDVDPMQHGMKLTRLVGHSISLENLVGVGLLDDLKLTNGAVPSDGHSQAVGSAGRSKHEPWELDSSTTECLEEHRGCPCDPKDSFPLV